MSAGVKAIILTLLAAAAVYLAGNARVQLWDRDEPRYAQCSRQMLQSGDWVVPRLYDKLRFQKPPLIYWCQASAMKFFGSEDGAGAFSARLPSVIAMLATLIVLAIAISKHIGVKQAAWTVFVMASSVMTIVAAKTCLTDSVLLLFVTIAQLCVYAIWRGSRSWSIVLVLAIMFGLGGLTKGPFILGISACTLAALGVFHLVGKFVTRPSRPWVVPAESGDVPAIQHSASHATSTGETPVSQSTHLFHLAIQIAVGLFIIAAITVPWLLLVHHRAPEFLDKTMTEAEAHAVHGKEGHNFPPGYHLLLVWPMFMPWSLLLPMAIGVGIHNRKIPQVRFALAAVLGPWLMVEFIGTKLPHYLLPAYPAMAYLVAFTIRNCLAQTSASSDLHPRRDKRSAAPDPGVIPEDRGRRFACPGVDEEIVNAPNGLGSNPFLVAAAFWALVILCIGALPWLAAGSIHVGKLQIGTSFRPLPWLAMVGLTMLGSLFGVGVFILLYCRKFAPAFVAMGVGMLASIGVTSACYFPDADFLRISTHVAGVLKDIGATHRGDVKMVGYLEPSLAFYQGGTIREVEKHMDLVSKPLDRWPHWVVMSREVWNMLPTESRGRLRVIDTCRGLAYSDGGRVVEVMVVENRLY